MLEHELRRDHGILIVRPKGPLDAADFVKVARDIDPHIEAEGKLVGLLVDAPSFPGWNDFAGLIAHFRFVRDHHRKIRSRVYSSDPAYVPDAAIEPPHSKMHAACGGGRRGLRETDFVRSTACERRSAGLPMPLT